MSDVAERLVAPCAERIIDATLGKGEVTVDIGALVHRVILFDRYTIQSVRLMEIPHLLPVFSFNGTMALLQSGVVDLECDSTLIALTPPSRPRDGRDLPSYYFAGAIRITRR